MTDISVAAFGPAQNSNNINDCPPPWISIEYTQGADVLWIADAPDENGDGTGVDIYITGPDRLDTDNASSVTALGWPRNVWRFITYTANGGTNGIRLENLPAGASFSILLAGEGGSASRDTDFTCPQSVQGTVTYDASGDFTNPGPQVTLSGTVPGDGIVSFSFTRAAVGGQFYGYLNGFVLTYDTGAGTPPSFTGNIANQVDAEDSPITPLDTAAQFDAGTGSNPVYSTVPLPLGLSLNTATGEITGTPTTPGTVGGIVVTLTTDEGSADSNPFSWEITDATSPSLSAPAAGSITSDGVTPIVTTNDTQNGSMWALVELGANPDPDAATIKANGEQLDAPFSAPVIFTPVTGLIPGNDYQISFYQEDQAGNPSNVARVSFQTIAVPNVIVYTVQADPPPGSYSILDGSGCGIDNQVEVQTNAEGTPITWNLPFDGTFVIQGESPPGYVFEARSRIDNASPWTPIATFQVNQ